MEKPDWRYSGHPIIDEFLWGVEDGFLDPFAQVAESSLFNRHLDNFKSNLRSAISVGSIPFIIAKSAVVKQRLTQLFIAQKILHDDGHPEDEVRQKAVENFHIEIDQLDGNRVMAEHTLDFLTSLNETDALKAANDDLMRQVLVLVWSAFEVLCSDVAVLLLNEHPILVAKIDKSKRFQDNISFETMKIYDFNVSDKMGEVVFMNRNIDSIPSIREFYDTVLCDEMLSRSLGDKALWRLFQSRNLIVHNRGIVDRKYVDKTGATNVIGSLLHVTRLDVNNYLAAVRDAGLNVLRACAAYHTDLPRECNT